MCRVRHRLCRSPQHCRLVAGQDHDNVDHAYAQDHADDHDHDAYGADDDDNDSREVNLHIDACVGEGCEGDHAKTPPADDHDGDDDDHHRHKHDDGGDDASYHDGRDVMMSLLANSVLVLKV